MKLSRMTNQNEIVIYQPTSDLQLQVRLENETVWLTQAQMAQLFQRAPQNITMHIRNIYLEGELSKGATCKEFLQVQREGPRDVTRRVSVYNLDVIISVGYRVKSPNGTAFRIWANNVIKNYLLNGYAFAQRFERLEHRVSQVEEQQRAFDIEIHAALPPTQGVFFEGQVFGARVFVEDLIRSAKREVVLIDTYVNSDVIAMLNERGKGVSATIYTDTVNAALKQAEELSEKQNGRKIEIRQYKSNFHDRFLIIDDDLYHFGASFKDLGRRLFAFEKMGIDKRIILEQV